MQCKDILQLKLQTGIKNIHVNQCMGIQKIRLNACIYGSNFAYKKFTFKSFKTERHWQKKKFYYGNKNINSDDI